MIVAVGPILLLVLIQIEEADLDSGRPRDVLPFDTS